MSAPDAFADPDSAKRFADLNCESRSTEAQRQSCYEESGILDEISKEQEKTKAVKALTNGFIYLCIIGVIGFLFWLFFIKLRTKKRRVIKKVFEDTADEVAETLADVVPMEPIAEAADAVAEAAETATEAVADAVTGAVSDAVSDAVTEVAETAKDVVS